MRQRRFLFFLFCAQRLDQFVVGGNGARPQLLGRQAAFIFAVFQQLQRLAIKGTSDMNPFIQRCRAGRFQPDGAHPRPKGVQGNGEMAVVDAQGSLVAANGGAAEIDRGRPRRDQGLVVGLAQFNPGFQGKTGTQFQRLGKGYRNPILFAIKDQPAPLTRFELDVDRLAVDPQPLHRKAALVVFEDRIFAVVGRAAYDLHQVACGQPVIHGVDGELAIAAFCVAGEQPVKDQPGFLVFHLLPIAYFARIEGGVYGKVAFADRPHPIKTVVVDRVAQFDDIAILQFLEHRFVRKAYLHPYPVGAVVLFRAAHTGDSSSRSGRAFAQGADVVEQVERQQHVVFLAAPRLQLGFFGNLSQTAIGGNRKAEGRHPLLGGHSQ